MNESSNKPKLLIFVVAYHAEGTIASVMRRIPNQLLLDYHVELLIIDDASRDRTFELSVRERESGYPFPIHVLHNPVNQGYGGNQKIGFHYAIQRGFDFVALVHGDGQYAPERLPDLTQPLKDGDADAVFGSRMMTRGAALRGGMPFYKYVGNKILTWAQNHLLGSDLSEFHSGYRIYSTAALQRIPFDRNTNDFHFDTQIIIQLMIAQQRIKELAIPTYYGDEICRVNGMKYAWDVFITTLKAVIQQRGIFYDRKFDCAPSAVENAHYSLKLGYKSPHSLAISLIPTGARILDIGCAGGYVGAELQKKGCKVSGVDIYPLADGIQLDNFFQGDLNEYPLPDGANFDYFMALDVIEHLLSPEKFVERVKLATRFSPDVKIIVSTGNIAFFVQRLMLMMGNFNYGKRGILDRTHTRLFTFSSMRNLFEQAGFDVIKENGVPAPFPLAVGSGVLARLLLGINNALIRASRSLFAYQIFMIVKPRPSLEHLLQSAMVTSGRKLTELALENKP